MLSGISTNQQIWGSFIQKEGSSTNSQKNMAIICYQVKCWSLNSTEKKKSEQANVDKY